MNQEQHENDKYNEKRIINIIIKRMLRKRFHHQPPHPQRVVFLRAADKSEKHESEIRRAREKGRERDVEMVKHIKLHRKYDYIM